MNIEPYQIKFDSNFPSILFELGISIVFSTYQAGKLMSLGSLDGDRLHQIPISFKKPMGIAIKEDNIAVACLDEIEVFGRNNFIVEHKSLNDKQFDAFFISRITYNTSSLDIHDLDFGQNKIWGVNTMFSCLVTFDMSSNFVFKWKPSFINEIVPEDRCHLNGMAMRDDLPRFVTALSKTNHKDGWRSDIMNSGVLLEVPSSTIILEGLSMPHSPRFYNNELYLLTSGNGQLIKVDVTNKTYELIYDFGKFVRGLTFIDKYAFVGTSKIRESSKTFNGLDVKENSKHAGIIIFDMKQKKVVGELSYINTIDEIFDVQILSKTLKPAIINKQDERSKQVINFANQVFWRKPKED
jgi:uncharacterized protein (TIGR03032 family)